MVGKGIEAGTKFKLLSVALDAEATPDPFPAALTSLGCLCARMDVPHYLFEDGLDNCPLTANEPAFQKMSVVFWFCSGVPLLLELWLDHVAQIPL